MRSRRRVSLFTENQTNNERIYKRAISIALCQRCIPRKYVVQGRREAVNPAATGTKAAARYLRTIHAGRDTVVLYLRLAAAVDEHLLEDPLAYFDALLAERKEEADEFDHVVLPSEMSADAKLVARQLFAGML